ncbi:MAG: hypothetical protein IIX54_00180 [Clostridia bacterium]|nr:hypothetical protein [Clostridia bacterium]
MKKIFALILALALIFCFAACGKADSTEEPKNDNTSATTVEVEDLLSEKGGFLEYTYSNHVINDKGQIESRQVSGDSRRTDTFEYDDQGRVVKVTRSSAYGDEIWTYTYDENGLLIEEFQGDRTFNNTYTLDDQNRVKTKTSVNADSGYTMVYTYTYNEDGTVATETQASETSTYELTFTYDQKGRVVKQVAVNLEDFSPSTTIYTYGVVGTYTPKAE